MKLKKEKKSWDKSTHGLQNSEKEIHESDAVAALVDGEMQHT